MTATPVSPPPAASSRSGRRGSGLTRLLRKCRTEVVRAAFAQLPRPPSNDLRRRPALLDGGEHAVERARSLLQVLDHAGPLTALTDRGRHQVRGVEPAVAVLQD